MSMNLINQGRTAEIFDLGNNKILKLFRKSTNLTAIEEEMTMANIIQDYNLPIPKFFGKMEYDERIGLIYEYITGQTLSFCLLRKPWALFSFAKQMAEIHSMIHKVKLEEIPGPNYQQKYRLEWIINHTDKLTVEAKKITIDFLNQLSEGHSLCHGDMNPNNILLSDQGPVVIDWMSATVGNPAGDVARIIIVLKYSALPSDLPFLLRIIAKMLLSSFCALYIKRYIKITGINRDEIKQWELPIAAGSLSDNAPLEETKRLLKFIHKELNLDSASTF